MIPDRDLRNLHTGKFSSRRSTFGNRLGNRGRIIERIKDVFRAYFRVFRECIWGGWRRVRCIHGGVYTYITGYTELGVLDYTYEGCITRVCLYLGNRG
jgi:hypothetical protein